MPVSLCVSFVIYAPPLNPTFKAVLENLQGAIKDARRNQILGDITIVLIDNGDNETILEKVLDEATDDASTTVTLIRNPDNVGYSAHNQAIQFSDADYHLVLNPDVLLSTSSLSSGLAYINANPATVMICPYSEGQQGNPSYLSKRFPAVLDLALRGMASETLAQRFDDRLKRYEYRDLPTDQIIRGVELISGCCMLARTEPLKRCGGFDERFFLYFEDFDLSLRMRSFGQLDYCPDMQIIHYGGNAASKGFRHITYFLKSAIRFYQKHGLRVF